MHLTLSSSRTVPSSPHAAVSVAGRWDSVAALKQESLMIRYNQVIQSIINQSID